MRVRSIIFCALGLALLLAPAVAQQSAGQPAGQPRLKIKELGQTTQPASLFDHDAHNAKAGLDDKCTTCHHGGQGLVKNAEEDTSGQACADCHKASRSDGGTPLRLAFHRQCMACHAKQNKGPTACGSCHAPGA